MKRVLAARNVKNLLILTLIMVFFASGCMLFPPVDDDFSKYLRPGEVIKGEDGVSVGAPDGVLDKLLRIYIESVEDPTTEVPLPDALQEASLIGKFYSVGSEKDFSVREGEFLILGLPVPDGVSTDDLAILVLSRPGSVVSAFPEEEDSSIRWNPLRGVYDEESGLFGTIIPFVGAEPEIYVLAKSIGYNEVEVAEVEFEGASIFDIKGFYLSCIGFSDGECIQAHIDMTRAALEDALETYVNTIGFSKPNLRVAVMGISFSPPSFVPILKYEYELRKGTVNGAYVPSQRIAYTRYPGLPAEPDPIITRHEFFHSIQFAYPALQNDWTDRTAVWGVFEGTAVAAELHMNSLERSNTNYNGREPLSINSNLFSRTLPWMADADAYRTQDFWVYAGLKMNASNQNIGYVKALFELGSLRSDIDQMFQSEGTFSSLSDAYWQWVKNQSFEKSVILGLDSDGMSVPHGEPNEWSGHGDDPATVTVSPALQDWDDMTKTFSLSPLTSRVYRLVVSPAFVDYMAEASVESTNENVQFKFYGGEENIFTTSWDDNEAASFIPDGGEITTHVLISNTSFEEPKAFVTLRIKLSRGPLLSIVNGPSGTVYLNEAVFEWQSEPSDKIVVYEIRKDEGVWESNGLSTTYKWSDMTPGDRIFEVRARDDYGLKSEVISWPFTYDEGFLMNAIFVDGGASHTIALKEDGTVWAWGSNEFGQLGNGTWTDSNTAVRVGGKQPLTKIIAIAAGYNHSVALRSDGTVWAWGRNGSGQLGNGTSINSNIPVQVKAPDGKSFLDSVVAIAAGGEHTLALMRQIVPKIEILFSWGNNKYGQLGDGTWNHSSLPVQVGGKQALSGILSIAAGYLHSAAVMDDGTVRTWGDNNHGQLGIGVSGGQRNTPEKVVGLGGKGDLTEIVAVAAGGGHTIVLQRDPKTNINSILAWGLNESGQLGNNTQNNSNFPVQVKGPGGFDFLLGAIEIAAGDEHSKALTDDRIVYSWGDNEFGQLGDGSWTRREAPVQVINGPQLLQNVVTIGAGAFHSMAVKRIWEGGLVWTWGLNEDGQLGDGTTSTRNQPVRVKEF